MPLEEKKKHTNANHPLVSIITPLYNAASYIAKTIASVQAQTYTNWQLIIVDDLSNDNSLQIAQSLAINEHRITIIPQKTNQGAAVARNLATQKAKGTYIAFLDADDLWHPEKLEKQIAFMEAQDCAVSFTSYLHIDENGKSLNKRIKALKELSYRKQHRNNYIGNLTGVYNAAILGKINAPSIRKRQDWAVWLDAIKKSKKPALGIQEDLAYYRVHKASMSANKLHLVKHNFAFYKTFLGYNTIKASYNLVLFFWEYFVNRPKQIERIN